METTLKRPKTLAEMSRDEISLLLFLETCAVDSDGKIDTRHMNIEDMKLAKQWHEERFIVFRRLSARYILRQPSSCHYTHRTALSTEALGLAVHARLLRIRRGIRRMMEKLRKFREEGL